MTMESSLAESERVDREEHQGLKKVMRRNRKEKGNG